MKWRIPLTLVLAGVIACGAFSASEEGEAKPSGTPATLPDSGGGPLRPGVDGGTTSSGGTADAEPSGCAFACPLDAGFCRDFDDGQIDFPTQSGTGTVLIDSTTFKSCPKSLRFDPPTAAAGELKGKTHDVDVGSEVEVAFDVYPRFNTWANAGTATLLRLEWAAGCPYSLSLSVNQLGKLQLLACPSGTGCGAGPDCHYPSDVGQVPAMDHWIHVTLKTSLAVAGVTTVFVTINGVSSQPVFGAEPSTSTKVRIGVLMTGSGPLSASYDNVVIKTP